MAITSILRDWGVDPAIVRITTDDSLSTVTGSGYLTAQASNISTLNNGAFEWADGDLVSVAASDGKSYMSYDASTGNLLAQAGPSILQHKQIDLTLAQFIGSYTASVELVAAPGANKKLILHRATIWIDYGGTVLADGGAVHIQYADTANAGGTAATGTQAAATFIGATADTTLGFSPVDTTLTDSTTLNEGLYLATATQDFTGGTDSVYKVDVWYSVADFA